MELFGRDRELELLERFLSRLADGEGSVLSVSGAAGAGKSALLDRAVHRATELGIASFVGRCEPLLLGRPMAAVLDALAVDAEDLVVPDSLLRPVVEAAGGSAGHLLAERAVDRLEAATGNGPVLVVLDDLHDADAVTRHFVDLLVERSHDQALGLLGGARIALDQDPLVTPCLALEPLSDTATAALAGAVVGGSPGPRLERSIATAMGSPLLVIAVAAAARSAGATTDSHGLMDLPAGAAPLTAGPVLAELVASLTPDALELAQAVAVLGTRAALAEAASLMATDEPALTDPADELVRAGVVLPGDTQLSFGHALYRAAVLDTLSANRSRQLHREAATMLAERRAPILSVAEHEVQGAEAGDARAAAYLRAAAREVVRSAPASAVTLLEQAAQLAGQEAGEEDDESIVLRLVALGASGRPAEVEHRAHEALRHDLPIPVQIEIQRELAFVQYTQNRAGEALATMDALLELVTSPDARARGLAESAFAAVSAADLAGARTRANEALALDGANNATGATANSVLCLVDTFEDHLERAVGHGTDAVRQARRADGVEGRRFQPWFCAALALLESDEFDDAGSLIETGRTMADSTGAVWALPGYDALAAFAAVRSGQLDDAAAFAAAVLPCIGDTDGLRVGAWAHAFLAQVELRRGSLGNAERHVNEGTRLLSTGEALLGTDQIALAQGCLLAANGNVTAAREVLQACWDVFAMLGVDRARHDVAVDLVRLQVATGQLHAATAVADWLERSASRTKVPTMRLLALHAQLLVTPDASLAHAVPAAAAACARRLRAADALADAATVLSRTGATSEAAALRVDAAHIYANVGAEVDLAALAPRLPKSARFERPRTGWQSLTASERLVLDRLALGEPNAVIAEHLGISRRTVESHVSSAYSKLHIRSRVELARAVAAKGPLSPASATTT